MQISVVVHAEFLGLLLLDVGVNPVIGLELPERAIPFHLYLLAGLVYREVVGRGKQSVPPRFPLVELITEFALPREEVGDEQRYDGEVEYGRQVESFLFHVTFVVFSGAKYT